MSADGKGLARGEPRGGGVMQQNAGLTRARGPERQTGAVAGHTHTFPRLAVADTLQTMYVPAFPPTTSTLSLRHWRSLSFCSRCAQTAVGRRAEDGERWQLACRPRRHADPQAWPRSELSCSPGRQAGRPCRKSRVLRFQKRAQKVAGEGTSHRYRRATFRNDRKRR